MTRASLAHANAIREGIALAVHAPSIHNTQPWLWRMRFSGVDLHADSSYALPIADPDGRELLLSCGAAMHHFCFAIAARGWQAEVQRFPKLFDPYFLARIDVTERRAPSSEEAAAVDVILRRRTDRRSFDARPVPPEHLSELTRRCARHGVIAQLSDADDRALMTSAFHDAAARHSRDPAYQLELASWSGLHNMDDGVPAANIADASRGSHVPTRAFAESDLKQPDPADHVTDASAWIVLGTLADDVASRARAGEAMSDFLLTATKMGLASCPMSEALEFPDLRGMIRNEIATENAFPQMIVRVGWPIAGAQELPPTPRRPIEDVLLPRREFEATGIRWP
ncbi:Acg family FMN-binding oxidoreductase [Aldersonia kunmingensis]|uniref:Acg family FMN-binding oxidoreductase n=1 Tax=Aldersonia kunmingensis TaxID=408066 RepID=UPI00082BC161|nr:nitroreductase family protein [Aldersonia kunmingensis]